MFKSPTVQTDRGRKNGGTNIYARALALCKENVVPPDVRNATGSYPSSPENITLFVLALIVLRDDFMT